MNVVGILKTAGGAVLHVIEAPFEDAAKIAAILKTGVQDEPELRAAITQLVSLGEKVVGDGAVDIANKGLNIPADLATWTAVQALFAYFSGTFIPLVKQVYGEVKADLNVPAADATNTTTTLTLTTTSPVATIDDAGSVAQSGPGLHNIVPA